VAGGTDATRTHCVFTRSTVHVEVVEHHYRLGKFLCREVAQVVLGLFHEAIGAGGYAQARAVQVGFSVTHGAVQVACISASGAICVAGYRLIMM
jgi:hypothetical protein